jgi:hypothetical protein
MRQRAWSDKGKACQQRFINLSAFIGFPADHSRLL